MEDRLLLFTDPFFSAEMAPAGVDLRLLLESSEGVDTLKLVNRATGKSLASAPVLEITGAVRIVGSGHDDTLLLTLEPSFVGNHLPNGILFEAGPGRDLLQGPSGNSAWNITATNEGNIGGSGIVDFESVENLVGESDNEDTFVFVEGGSLTGVVEGGSGGFDSVVYDGGSYASVILNATGPDSGTIDLDGNLITYSGMEPVTLTASGIADVLVSVSGMSDDDLEVSQSAGSITVASVTGTIESVTFPTPSSSLTIDTGDGSDSVTLTTTLLLPGVDLQITSEIISVNSGLTVSTFDGVSTYGDITFSAVAVSDDTPPIILFADVDASAQINVSGATLTGGDITLTASSKAISDDVINIEVVDEASAAVALVSSEALISIDGASAISSHVDADSNGDLLVAADSQVFVTVSATSQAIGGLGTDVAAAASIVDSTAEALVLGTTTIDAEGEFHLSAENDVDVTTHLQEVSPQSVPVWVLRM